MTFRGHHPTLAARATKCIGHSTVRVATLDPQLSKTLAWGLAQPRGTAPSSHLAWHTFQPFLVSVPYSLQPPAPLPSPSPALPPPPAPSTNLIAPTQLSQFIGQLQTYVQTLRYRRSHFPLPPCPFPCPLNETTVFPTNGTVSHLAWGASHPS